MLSTSFEFRRKVSQSSSVLFKATLTLSDGTVRDITGDDVMSGTVSFSDAVSSDSSFDVGAAVMNKLSFTLNNFDGRFDEYDFTGATIVPYVGVELDGTDPQTGEHLVEWLQKGVYGVDQPASYGGTIGITALDNMRLLEIPYSEVTTAYPATLGSIVQGICAKCGVSLLSQTFANHSYSVGTRPDDSALTCRDVVSAAAQVAGCFARFDNLGRLSIGWYDLTAFEGEDWLDGGTFDDAVPYASGDTADGGSFLDYSSGDDADGGGFTAPKAAHVFAMAESTIVTDDVVVTGVRVTASSQVLPDGGTGNQGETALSGTEGYVLEIEGNPLILYGRASTVAAQVAARVVGMRFRPFSCSAVGSPAWEAGDPAIIIDRRQNQYRTFLTRCEYRIGSHELLACGAETPSRNSAAGYSEATRAAVAGRNAVRREAAARETALATMALMLASASGLYKTEDVQSDGSTVYYLHDKPTLAQSETVWKATANAFGVSNDGGATYTYGVDNNGVAILNQIYANGIDADYITSGIISDRSGSHTWNLDTGVFSALDNLSACVRQYGQGVLVCRPNNTIGALINADGSFEVVTVTWNNGVPTAGAKKAICGEKLFRIGPYLPHLTGSFEVGERNDFATRKKRNVLRYLTTDEGVVEALALYIYDDNGDIEFNACDGLLKCYSTYDYKQSFSIGGYPGVIYYNGDLAYYNNSSSPIPLSIVPAGQGSNTVVQNAISSVPAWATVSDTSVTVNGNLAEWSANINISSYNSDDPEIGYLASSSMRPTKGISAIAYVGGGEAGTIEIQANGYIYLLADKAYQSSFSVRFTAVWLRNG